MIWYVLSLIIVGLIVGALARLLHPGKDEMSLPMTIGLGAISMLIGGLLLRPLIGIGGGFISSVIIAVVLLFLFGKYSGRSNTAGNS